MFDCWYDQIDDADGETYVGFSFPPAMNHTQLRNFFPRDRNLCLGISNICAPSPLLG